MAFIINGEKIGDDVFEDEFESIKEHYISAGEAVCCDRDEEFRAYATENVINRVLLEQASIKEYGEVSEADVNAKFESIVAEHGGADAFYDNTGFNRGDEFMLRRKVKSSLMVDRYLADKLGEETEPTEEELKAYYEANIEHYMSPVEVEVSQLFVEPTSHEAAKEVYDSLYLARKEMLNSANFLELAQKHSGLEPDEIQMGFIKQGENMPEIDAIVFSMQPGEISPILATPFGFHLFNVTGRKDPSPVPMSDIPNLESSFVSKRREDRINHIINDLKEAGSVEEIEEAPV
ncbi:MAG: peptidyl-prolyl cis-trans isomerase [Verrucomicrobiales bacterium]|nr:peptidyl-prolyl cis-trans isomerase [Verrucomicrobiales bacterium]